MSYYEDTSHYCYTVPAHYIDTPTYYADTAPSDITSGYYDDSLSNDANTPSYDVNASLYDVDTSSHDVDTPLYDVDSSSYDVDASSYNINTYPDLIYYEDDSYPEPTWSPSLPISHGIEHEHELETYAEAASARTYLEDEIHPAYHDPIPVNSNSEESHHSHTTSDEPLSVLRGTDEQGYYWTVREFTNKTRYDPPSCSTSGSTDFGQ